MNLVRPAKVIVYGFLGISAFCIEARAQGGVVDTMKLALAPPESVYTRTVGDNIVVGWYPPNDSMGGSRTGSRNFVNWYVNDPEVSVVDTAGFYSGTIDRVLTVSRIVGTLISRDRVGFTPSIKMKAEIRELNETYFREFNLGSSYTPGDTIPMVLVGRETRDTLDTGIGLIFHEGVVDTAFGNRPAFFDIDLQTYEGFHVWRGVWRELPPKPSEMTIITELSRDNAYIGVERDSIYFAEWPKKDPHGRPYYEFVDDDTFAGFTYYYVVTCFDRGYLQGQFQFSKTDNFICDEDTANSQTPHHPVICENFGTAITKAVRTGTDMTKIYAVPNPYRTGTSAETTPSYHNYPDGSIKFFNVPKETDLKIYTVAGDLVWETHHSSPSGDNGVITWNVKNRKGQKVGSGVYIYRCKSSDGGDMYGRIVVIN